MHSFILWNSQFQSLSLYLNLCSMIHAYAYTDSKHSATPMPIESKYYTSDANGNQDSIPNIERRMYWDEDNRLMVLSDNGKTSRYTYNAAGERIMKSYGTMEGVYINGAPGNNLPRDGQLHALSCFDNQHQQEPLHKALLHW